MNYQETINFLFQKLPIYQRVGNIAYKKDIGNILKASEVTNNPHKNFKSIHIAGTNGKGSTSHMISSIIQEAGYNVGLYTSPHLKDFRERIRINGKKINKKEVTEFINIYKLEFEKINMSFFEITVSMAFYYFSKKKVDIAVIETGLGGRLDSTNIINPEISVITNIGLDHTALLGDNLCQIAEEKSGIIKEKTPVIIGRKQKECVEIFRKKSLEKKSELIFAKKYSYNSDLLGEYQKENINTAVTTIKNLNNYNISEQNIIDGLLKVRENTSLLGRWQIIDVKPKIICDTAHNIDGIKSILKQLKKERFKQLHFIIGMVKDKEITKILQILPLEYKYYFCKPNIIRGIEAKLLYKKAGKFGLKGNVYETVSKAFIASKNNVDKDDLIFIGGSTFLASEII